MGNLIGGSAVITLFIIPLLALTNREVRFDESSKVINLPLAYLIISLPVFLVIDKTLSLVDSIIIFLSMGLLLFTISTKKGLLEKIEGVFEHPNVNVWLESFKAIVGVLLIIVSCKYIVDSSVKYAEMFSIPPFLLGLVFISIGTNLPELTLFIRSTLDHTKYIALGDYIGSSVVNSIIFAFLIIFNKGPIHLENGIKYNLFLLPIGSILLLIFAKDRRLKKYESLILLLLYGTFVLYELLG